ncbi:MAG: hypothetical protein IPH84_18270 [Bacteroidales bacterium]|nr:hypothetical protein [Bacteroidales bacterium]
MGTGAWSIVSGGTGTFSDNTDPDATFTADAYGTYVLRWSISNGTMQLLPLMLPLTSTRLLPLLLWVLTRTIALPLPLPV